MSTYIRLNLFLFIYTFGFQRKELGDHRHRIFSMRFYCFKMDSYPTDVTTYAQCRFNAIPLLPPPPPPLFSCGRTLFVRDWRTRVVEKLLYAFLNEWSSSWKPKYT